MNRSIERTQGELMSTARAVLAIYMMVCDNPSNETLGKVFERHVNELKRLVHNEFQFHGNDIGDPVQFSLTILLMAGEEHSASGRFTK